MSASTPQLWNWGDSLDPMRELLARGGILVIPTESSYGLAVDPRNKAAVENVYRCKGREWGSPLPVVLGDLGQLECLGADPESEVLLGLARAWPAPLTVVVDLLEDMDLPAAAGSKTLGIRVPRHRRLRELMVRLGTPLTSTSANRSGETPILDPLEAVSMMKGWDALVIHDGVLEGGAPSTIVRASVDGVSVLRQGSYPLELLLELAPTDSRSDLFSAEAAENPVDASRRYP